MVMRCVSGCCGIVLFVGVVGFWFVSVLPMIVVCGFGVVLLFWVLLALACFEFGDLGLGVLL